MQDGQLAGGDVPEWSVTVQVGSTVRQAASVSIDGELPSDMPDAIGGVSGISARTGTIVWAPQEVVQSRPVSPWTRAGSWPPAPGTPVGIWIGDEATSWKVFTGVTDETTGDESSMVTKIIDVSDRLDRPVTIPAVAHRMPGLYDEATGGSFANYTSHVQPWHASYRCLRAGGFGLTAPTQRGGTTILDVDFQGSIWPALGNVQHATGSEPTAMSWGDGFTYLSAGTVAYGPRLVPVSGGVRGWVRVAAIPGGSTGTLLFMHDGGKFVRVRASLDATHTTVTVTGEVWDGDPSGSGTMLGAGYTTAPALVEDGTFWAEVWIPSGGTAFRVVTGQTSATTSTPNGGISTSVPLGATTPSGGTWTRIGVGGRLVAVRAGVIDYTDWSAMTSHTSASRVRAWGQGLVRSQHTSRAIEGRTAASVLNEIGQATLTSMWIDETGVMQWAPSDRLYAQSPVKTVTTAQDIFELGWSESLLSTRRQITVSYLQGALNLSRRYGITLYQPRSGATLENGSTNEDFIDVPADEEWFGLDDTLMRIGTAETNEAFSQGHRSFYGGIYDDASGIQRWALSTSEFSYSMPSLGLRTWLLTQTNTRSDGHDLQLISKDEDAEASLKKRWRNQPLPIIRGRGRTAFTDSSYTATQTGPSSAPDLEHDLASWGQAADAKRVADWLASWLTTTLVTLTTLRVEYDPRLQLGDVITVESSLYGFRLDCLIIGKAEEHGSDGSSMTLSVRVIRDRTTPTVSWADLEAAWSDRTYQNFETAWAGSTYAQLESNPLGGS